MSPEQLGGQKVDRRSDIYSAAIVVWEMLAGRVLFRADNDGALMIIVAVGPTQSPTDVNAEVPAAISAACMRALALQANDRYPTAMAFADALEAAAREAHVTIAAPRTVGALVKECPPERPRTSSIVSRPGGGSGSVDSAPVSMGSGVSGQSAPVSRSPASVGHAPQNPSGAEIPRTSESGRTPSSISTSLAAESTRQDSVVTPARGTAANRRNMLVAAVSVVVVGAVVWLVLTAGRGNPATAVQDDRNGAPAASDKTALGAPSSALDPLPETSSSAPTNPTSDKRATATSATSKTRPGTAPAPRATSKSSTFRPEEP